MISDPRARSMNETRWIYELENVNVAEEDRYEEYKLFGKLARQGMINLLGLNMLPVEEDDGEKFLGGPTGAIQGIDQMQPTRRLRRMKEEEFIPLAAFVGREEIMGEVLKRSQELQVQEEMEDQLRSGVISDMSDMTPEEFDEFMDEGDIEFEDNPNFMQEEWAKALQHVVRPVEELQNDLGELYNDDIMRKFLQDMSAPKIEEVKKKSISIKPEKMKDAKLKKSSSLRIKSEKV